ncbi:aminotransferase class V-fold PLP-dependent enzyme [Nonlabens ponticola]|uniref:Aminotransferase class V-fold PLP-dependent enzyme n=1 Tax=Nonlabens ponticola TaxID=2496866 RepID=A0A3S9MUT1_9FLAO|nr:aminotransferase class V-fold PLP-dependent enzyme [Nonlabens ponticola]AZQ42928.1 aminotransferase class V-fold PLP-dependent enzyme [Nonlabens ponticola]
MHKLKELYPVLDNYTYLNTAAHGLVSTGLKAYKNDLLHRMTIEGSEVWSDPAGFMDNVRSTVAQFLDADEHLTALIPNFSIGFNTLLDGMDKSLKFLLVDGDYPSINWPVQARGFDCVYATLDHKVEDHIADACRKHRPDVLALSLVQYITGIKIDLDFIDELKVQYPDMIVIADGTQFTGAFEFSFRESKIDILAASCYKWLHAGDGNAYMIFKEDAIERIKPAHIGFNSVQGSKDRGSFIGHFEPGHQDLLAYGGLQHAIQFATDYGLRNIELQQAKLASHARQHLLDTGMINSQLAKRKTHSSIINIKGDVELMQRLRSNNILCSLRGEGIRVSFAHFNTIDDVSKLLRILSIQN